MNDTAFSLAFALLGMSMVFAVITILTLAMVVTGTLFASRDRQVRKAEPLPSSEPGEAGEVPAEHVAVIAAALSIQESLAASEITLLDPGGDAWQGPSRVRPGPGSVPSLRRTR
jgi:Na+-transporting methylmalonyl-CoA/oxaloacetate decarboxylase gamma subunit